MLIYIQPLRFETIETDVVNSFSAESIPWTSYIFTRH